MNKKERQDKLKLWSQLIHHAVECRKELECEWHFLYDLYRHRHPTSSTESRHSIQVNKVFSTVNVIEASHFITEPHINVNALNRRGEGKAVVCEHIMNYWWKEHKFQKSIREASKDATIIGIGWNKIGWRFQAEPDDPDHGQPVANKPAEGRRDSGMDEEDRPQRWTVKYDEPTVERVSPFDIWVDPAARDMCEARWIAQRIKITKSQFEKRTKKRGRKGGYWRDIDIPEQGDVPRYLDGQEGLTNTKVDPRDWVEIWEFYDLEDQMWGQFVIDGDDFLLDPETTPYEFGHPYEVLMNHDDTEDFYPMGDVVAIADLQRELNQIRTDQSNYRRTHRLQYWYAPELKDSEFLDMVTSDEDNVWAPLPGDLDIEAAFGPIEQTQVPIEFYNQSQLISADIDEISGVSEYQRGRAAGTTATEAAIANASSQARAALRVSDLEDFMGGVARKVLTLAQQYMTEDISLRITGMTIDAGAGSDRLNAGRNNTIYYEATPDVFNANFDLGIEAGSTRPDNETQQAQRAVQLMSVLAPLVPTGGINLSALVREVVLSLGVKDPDKFLTGEFADPSLAGNVGTPPGGPATDPVTSGQGVSPQDPGSITQLEGQVGLSL